MAAGIMGGDAIVSLVTPSLLFEESQPQEAGRATSPYLRWRGTVFDR